MKPNGFIVGILFYVAIVQKHSFFHQQKVSILGLKTAKDFHQKISKNYNKIIEKKHIL
jgi:hypothetical protein